MDYLNDYYRGMIYCRYCGEQIEPYRERCPYCASILRNKHSYRYLTRNVPSESMQADIPTYLEQGEPERDVDSTLSDRPSDQNEDLQTSIQEEQKDTSETPV
ncbi:MAG: hypothetical protein PHV32_19145, partial [Eubacteriales bacterium]|nr:hypothetical protein [Eubacteriales bacterium]